MKSTPIFFPVLIIGIYLIVDHGAAWLGGMQGWSYPLRLSLFYGSYLLVPGLTLALLYGLKQVPEQLGLNRSLWRAFALAGVCTLPMLIGYTFTSETGPQLDPRAFLVGALLPAVGEEVLFRGFLFGQLFRKAGWGFIPAAGISALVFGIGHLYQGNTLGETLGVFGVTLLGGLWFAYLYTEWQHNLWVPIAFHLLMNAYWDIFDMGTSALGGTYANLFRGLTIALSIILTLRLQPNRAIKRDNLWRQSKPSPSST